MRSGLKAFAEFSSFQPSQNLLRVVSDGKYRSILRYNDWTVASETITRATRKISTGMPEVQSQTGKFTAMLLTYLSNESSSNATKRSQTAKTVCGEALNVPAISERFAGLESMRLIFQPLLRKPVFAKFNETRIQLGMSAFRAKLHPLRSVGFLAWPQRHIAQLIIL